MNAFRSMSIDTFFQSSLSFQAITVGVILFALFFLLITLMLHLFTSRGFRRHALSGALAGLLISIIGAFAIYFFNDKVYSAYLKKVAGPQYIAEAQMLGATPDERLRVIMGEAFIIDAEDEATSIKDFKKNTYLNPDQFKRLFNVFKTCYSEDFAQSVDASKSDMDLFYPAKSYPVSHAEMSYFFDEYNKELNEILKSQNYQPRHPLCFSGKEEGYVLSGE